MIKKYHKTTNIPILAEQFDGSQKSVFGYKIVPDKHLVDLISGKPAYYFVLTGDDFEDEVVVEEGDWIVNNGTNMYSLDNESFNNNYAELPVIPDCVAEYIRDSKSIEDNNVIKSALGAIDYDQSNYIVADWIIKNGDDFARAWRYGYQVKSK